MGSFTLSNKAKADLKSIATYTQRKWGKNKRKIYLKQFDDSFFLLAESPHLGVSCDYIKENYRKFPVASHIIFYRKTAPDHIEIVRVLHKRMDAKTQFLNR